MAYPATFIDNIKSRISIVDAIGQHVALKKSGKEYVGLCPFHEEKTPSFRVNSDKGVYLCSGCGASGDVISFHVNHLGMQFRDAVEELAGKAGIQIPADDGTPQQDPTAKLYALLQQCAEFYAAAGPGSASEAYLQSRGFDANTIRAFGMGHAKAGNALLKKFGKTADDRALLDKAGMLSRNEDGGDFYDRFRNRLMIPIRDARGRVISFAARALEDSKPKYLNGPETALFKKSGVLFGLHLAAASKSQFFSVVEGQLDVAAMHQHGFDFAVAAQGTALTEAHLRQLFRVKSEVVLCFDGDKAGRKAANRAAATAMPLMDGKNKLYFAFMPDGEDPASLLSAGRKEHLSDALAIAQPLSVFIIGQAEGSGELSLEDRAAAAAELRALIAKAPEGDYKNLLLREMENALLSSVQTPNAAPDTVPAEDAVVAQDIKRKLDDLILWVKEDTDKNSSIVLLNNILCEGARLADGDALAHEMLIDALRSTTKKPAKLLREILKQYTAKSALPVSTAKSMTVASPPAAVQISSDPYDQLKSRIETTKRGDVDAWEPILHALADIELPPLKRSTLLQMVKDYSGIPARAINKAMAKDGATFSERQIADRIMDTLSGVLVDQMGNWDMLYQNGVWSKVSPEMANTMIDDAIAVVRPDKDYDFKTVRGVRNMLLGRLIRSEWGTPGHVPFRNGVLRLEDRAFLQHSPDFFFNWQLPFDFVEGADCPKTRKFLDEALEGDNKQITLLMAFMQCAIAGNAWKYQKYIEIIGHGGTGKGTVVRMFEYVIGETNVKSTDFKTLEGYRHDTAEIYGKRLVILPDADKYSGDTSMFQRLTGYDTMPYNEKRKQNLSGQLGFRYDGATLVACNSPVQSSNFTALERRRVPIHFRNKPREVRDVDSEIRAELPGIFNWAMSIKAELVDEIMRAPIDYAGNITEIAVDVLLRTNPLAAWANDCLYVNPEDPHLKTQVGRSVLLSDKETGRKYYESSDAWLIASYLQYCSDNGMRSQFSTRNFTEYFANHLCIGTLGLNSVKAPGRGRDGRYVHGVGIRPTGEGFDHTANFLSPIEAKYGREPPYTPPPRPKEITLTI